MDVKNLRGVNDVMGKGGYTALGDYLLRIFAQKCLRHFLPETSNSYGWEEMSTCFLCVKDRTLQR